LLMISLLIQVLKQELHQLETAQTKHILPRGKQERDPDKMADRINKMSVCLDLTSQRCDKYEAKIKELEGRYFSVRTKHMYKCTFHNNVI